MKNNKVITLDGAVATGKTTVSKIISDKLNGIYIPTGKLYRLISLYILKNNYIGIKNFNSNELEKINIYFDEGNFQIENFNYENNQLYSNEIMQIISDVSANKFVRDICNIIFRKIISDNIEKYIILEGRDAGTVIFKDAFKQFFLTVSEEESAKRRIIQLNNSGQTIEFEKVLLKIRERNHYDSNRSNSPLSISPLAIIIDTTNIDKDQVVKQILSNIDKSNEKK